MKKRTVILITSSLISSSAFVAVLFIASFDFSKQQNDFLRLFRSSVLIPTDTFDIQYDSYYFAGGNEQTIYLGNITSPFHILKLNLIEQDTQHIQLRLRNIDTLQYWSAKLRVNLPYFYLGDGTQPFIYSGNAKDWIGDRHIYDSTYFVEYVPIGTSSFAIRSLNSTSLEHELGKEQSLETPHVKFNLELLQKQIDGIFCIDGQLHYDKDSGFVVYTYHYRNEFIVMDTSLNLLYRGKTIDTVSHVRIDVKTIESSNTRTLSGPPLIVNGQGFASGGYLFINSKLLARNEIEDAHDKASVVDVYNLKDGSYKLSFYLYAFERKKPQAFAIVGRKLIAFTDHFVIVYDLNPGYFSDWVVPF